jgi:nitrate reductase gamma subunit
MTKDSLLFHAVTAATILLFAWGLYEHLTFWFSGNLRRGVRGSTGEKLSFALRMVGRALTRGDTYRCLAVEVLLQRQVLRESFSRWAMHVGLMWGLAGLFFIGSLGNMATDLHLLSPSKDAPWFAAANEVFGLMVLGGAAVALTRRYVLKLTQLKNTLDEVIIMGGIGLGVLSGYGLELARFNLEGVAAASAAYSFVAQWARQWLPLEWPWATIHPGIWWFHFLTGSALAAYLPHSKLFHVIVSPLSVIAHSLRAEEHREALVETG